MHADVMVCVWQTLIKKVLTYSLILCYVIAYLYCIIKSLQLMPYTAVIMRLKLKLIAVIFRPTLLAH